MPSSRKRWVFRLGFQGSIPVRQNKCSAEKIRVGFFATSGEKTMVLAGQLPAVVQASLCLAGNHGAGKFFRVFVLSDWNGQNLNCLMKCVGAKCTKRCCRVQQRSAQRFCLSVLSPEGECFHS